MQNMNPHSNNVLRIDRAIATALLKGLLSILLTVAPSIATAEENALGRLFYKPEERAALDRARRGIPDTPNNKTTDTPLREPTLTGYVKRSDGRSTIWVDGTPRYAPKTDIA